MTFISEHFKIILILFLLFNIITFFTYGIDKYKAIRDKWRVPESTLIILALVGGSVGALLGMKVFRHKTKHPKFYIGVPLILVLQIVSIGFILWKFR